MGSYERSTRAVPSQLTALHKLLNYHLRVMEKTVTQCPYLGASSFCYVNTHAALRQPPDHFILTFGLFRRH
jgi:hypothetical protein